jgi:flagellar motor switch protein FliM
MMCVQLERTWKAVSLTVAPLPSIKQSTLGQTLVLDDRLVLLEFEMRLDAQSNGFALALPMTLATMLVRNSHQESTRRTSLRSSAVQSQQERLLQCALPLVMELNGIVVPISELVAVRPGTVLNLRTPLKTPVVVRTGRHALFEVVAVRSGPNKAAQIVRKRDHEEGDR